MSKMDTAEVHIEASSIVRKLPFSSANIVDVLCGGDNLNNNNMNNSGHYGMDSVVSSMIEPYSSSDNDEDMFTTGDDSRKAGGFLLTTADLPMQLLSPQQRQERRSLIVESNKLKIEQSVDDTNNAKLKSPRSSRSAMASATTTPRASKSRTSITTTSTSNSTKPTLMDQLEVLLNSSNGSNVNCGKDTCSSTIKSPSTSSSPSKASSPCRKIRKKKVAVADDEDETKDNSETHDTLSNSESSKRVKSGSTKKKTSSLHSVNSSKKSGGDDPTATSTNSSSKKSQKDESSSTATAATENNNCVDSYPKIPRSPKRVKKKISVQVGRNSESVDGSEGLSNSADHDDVVGQSPSSSKILSLSPKQSPAREKITTISAIDKLPATPAIDDEGYLQQHEKSNSPIASTGLRRDRSKSPRRRTQQTQTKKLDCTFDQDDSNNLDESETSERIDLMTNKLRRHDRQEVDAENSNSSLQYPQQKSLPDNVEQSSPLHQRRSVCTEVTHSKSPDRTKKTISRSTKEERIIELNSNGTILTEILCTDDAERQPEFTASFDLRIETPPVDIVESVPLRDDDDNNSFKFDVNSFHSGVTDHISTEGVISISNDTSVVSENDASMPLLRKESERSCVVPNRAPLIQSSSLSDIEKSGMGVDRSIKNSIQQAKAKLKQQQTNILNVSSHSCEHEKQKSKNFMNASNHSSDKLTRNTTTDTFVPVALNDGLPIGNLQEFMSDDNLELCKLLKVATISDEYTVEEIEEVTERDEDDEIATMDNSLHISTVAAEMDEAMAKVWAKFDVQFNKSIKECKIDNDNILTANDKFTIPPHKPRDIENRVDSEDTNNGVPRQLATKEKTKNEHPPLATITTKKEQKASKTTSCDVSVDISEMTTQAPTEDITRTMESSNTASPKQVEAPNVTVSPLLHTESSTRVIATKPNDTRLSSLVKMLVVDVWSDDVTIVMSCLDQMLNICETDENAVVEMFQHGGHLVVIVLMRKFLDFVEIQIAALLTLQKAAECRNEFTEAIIALGALELIIHIMSVHAHNDEVVTAGCGALLNLTLPAKHAKVFVFELKGIQYIATASSNFPQNIALQKYVLWMIQYFSYWDDYKIQIVQQGGMQTLAKMIESFTSMNQQQQKNAMLLSAFGTSGNDATSTASNSTSIDSILKSASATMKRLL